MTKTLTEQWREGTLPFGNYYIKVKLQGEEKIIEHEISGSAFFYDTNVVLEILASVPSYETVCKLEQIDEDLTVSNECLKMANEKIERLEQQLQEANEVIKHYAEKNGYHKATDYLNKWGVK